MSLKHPIVDYEASNNMILCSARQIIGQETYFETVCAGS